MDARDGAGRIATSKTKLTYADFLLFPDDGQRHELIDGEHHVSERAGVREYWIVDPWRTKISVHRRGESGELRASAVLKAKREDVLHTALLPEFQLPLAEYFR
jgi:hypothetical protein